MKPEEQQVKGAALKIGKGIEEQLRNAVPTILKSTLETGKIPKEALGFSEERVRTIYAQAYRLYNTGKYTDASHLFRLLIALVPTDAKYYLGLAACFHLLKEYQGAVQVYTACAAIDAKSPVAYFHSSDCYIQLHDQMSAWVALQMAVERAGDQPAYQVLKERALLTIENIKKELEKQGVKLKELEPEKTGE